VLKAFNLALYPFHEINFFMSVPYYCNHACHSYGVINLLQYTWDHKKE